MIEFIRLCTGFLATVLKSRAGLQAENLGAASVVRVPAECQEDEGEAG